MDFEKDLAIKVLALIDSEIMKKAEEEGVSAELFAQTLTYIMDVHEMAAAIVWNH